MLQAKMLGDLPAPFPVSVGLFHAQWRPAEPLNFLLHTQTCYFNNYSASSPNTNNRICKFEIYLPVGLLADTALSSSKGEQAGSVFVKASWHSGGFLHVEAKAWRSAEVAMALSSNI